MNVADFADIFIWNGCGMHKAYLDAKKIERVVPIAADDNISPALAGAVGKIPQGEHWAILIYQNEHGMYALVDGQCGHGGTAECEGYQGMAVIADFFAWDGRKNGSSVICHHCAAI